MPQGLDAAPLQLRVSWLAITVEPATFTTAIKNHNRVDKPTLSNLLKISSTLYS